MREPRSKPDRLGVDVPPELSERDIGRIAAAMNGGSPESAPFEDVILAECEAIRAQGYAGRNDVARLASVANASLKSAGLSGGDDRGRKILSTRELLSTLVTEELIAGWLAREAIAAVVSYPGVGKSFVAIYVAIQVATGAKAFGRDIRCPGPVIYLTNEGRAGLATRIRAACAAAGVEDPPVYWDTATISLLLANDVDAFIAAVKALPLDTPPVLIVLDTLAQTMAPGDENSTKDMQAYVSAVQRIRDAFGCAVLVVHHTGHAARDRERGSVALRAGVDVLMLLERTSEGSSEFQLRTEKNKDGPPLVLSGNFKAVSLGVNRYGETISTCVVEPLDHKDTASCPYGPPKRFNLDATHRKILDTLSLTVFAENGASKTDLVTYTETAKQQEKTMMRRVSELIDNGYIRTAGARNRTRYVSTGKHKQAETEREDIRTSEDNVRTVLETGIETPGSASLEAVPTVLMPAGEVEI